MRKVNSTAFNKIYSKNNHSIFCVFYILLYTLAKIKKKSMVTSAQLKEVSLCWI